MRYSHFSRREHLKMESRYGHLDALESQSIYILREAYRKFKRLAMLWSIGKDSSVMLWLLRKAKSGRSPAHFIELESVLRDCRRHAANRVVACRLHERLEITFAGLPFRNVDISQRHETHVEAVCPWLSCLGWGMRTKGRVRLLRMCFSNNLRLLARCWFQDHR